MFKLSARRKALHTFKVSSHLEGSIDLVLRYLTARNKMLQDSIGIVRYILREIEPFLSQKLYRVGLELLQHTPQVHSSVSA